MPHSWLIRLCVLRCGLHRPAPSPSIDACVSADGRTFKQQILLNEAGQLGVRADLTRLASAVHAAGAKVSIQLTHGGGFADPAHSGGRTVAPSCVFNPAAMVRCRGKALVIPRIPQCSPPPPTLQPVPFLQHRCPLRYCRLVQYLCTLTQPHHFGAIQDLCRLSAPSQPCAINCSLRPTTVSAQFWSSPIRFPWLPPSTPPLLPCAPDVLPNPTPNNRTSRLRWTLPTWSASPPTLCGPRSWSKRSALTP